MLSTLILLLMSRRQREKAHQLLQAEKARADGQNIEIEIQRKALEENNQIRDRIFSVIAHDLRSPLNSLQAIMGLIKVGTLKEQELTLLLKGLTDRVDSTSMLVDNLLNWARSQLHGFQLAPARLDLRIVAKGQTELLIPQAESKNITLLNSVLIPMMVYADQGMVEVVVRNLVSNAIKFTPKGGEIILSAERKGEMIQFSVSDTGVGMSAEVKEKLFSGSYFSTLGTSMEVGSGLGLMLVKEFTEKNGGTCTVQSTPGKGSVFSVTFPAA
jgi:signal transduction histidine kinase